MLISRMNTNGDYANLEHLSVKEVLSENHIDKIVTLLATDKDENKVSAQNEVFEFVSTLLRI